MNKKMNTKRTLVSFLLVASVLLLTAAVSAAGTSTESIKVNDITVYTGGAVADTASIIAGDTITVQVRFNATVDASDVRMKATIEGSKNDVTAVTNYFDVESGNTYVKTLTMKVPTDFEGSDRSESLPLTVRVWNSNGDVDTEISSADLTVQKPSYNVAIKSVIASDTITAGTSVPVQVVLKNDGYNNVQDMYVTVSIPELNIQKQVYIGDLVTQDYKDSSSSSDSDKVSGSSTVYLDVPYDAKAGKYTLSIVASNDDTKNTVTKEIAIENGISDIAMKSGNDLVLLNPTNQLKVYTVKYDTNAESVVIPAASSKTVSINVPTSGDYKFDVAVMEGDKVLSTVNFSGSAQSAVQMTSPVFVLTVILAIVFLVLLVVLVVLITKKPAKTEEFGESYY